MEIIFLGTGTSQGVPMIGQSDPPADLRDPRNWRTRTSAHVILGESRIQIDAGQEFRLQALRNGIEWIDFFILTHGHADHVLGMDDLRRFCDARGGEALPVYSTPEGLERVRAIYPYAIVEKAITKGYPAFQLIQAPTHFEVPGGSIRTFPLPHGSIEVLGLLFTEIESGARIAYFTDCSDVPEEAREAARGAELVVLDGLRPHPHPSHMTIAEATTVAESIGGQRTLLTHMTSHVDHAATEATLPHGMGLAFDGLRVKIR